MLQFNDYIQEKYGDDETGVIDLRNICNVDVSAYDKRIHSYKFKHRTRKFPVKEIALSDLIATQKYVSAYKVKNLLSTYPDWSYKLPVVKEMHGKFYIQDGHHRFTALKMMNDKDVKIKCRWYIKEENQE